MIHPLIENARTIDRDSGLEPVYPSDMYIAPIGLSEAITRKILQDHPHIFDDVNYLMVGPTDFINDQVVAAISNPLKVAYDMDVAQQFVGVKDSKDAVIKMLAEGIFEELIEIRRVLTGQGHVMCPYQLVRSYKGVNHNTFEPEIRFTTRYGIFTPPL